MYLNISFNCYPPFLVIFVLSLSSSNSPIIPPIIAHVRNVLRHLNSGMIWLDRCLWVPLLRVSLPITFSQSSLSAHSCVDQPTGRICLPNSGVAEEGFT